MQTPDASATAGLGHPSRETLGERIFAQIKERLAMGQFMPGQRLPIRELAGALGVSAAPVRDALQRLEGIGVLSGHPSRTAMVPRLDIDRLAEIRDLRIAIEGLAAEYAARLADERDLEELPRRLQALHRAADAGDGPAFLQANWFLHRCVAGAAHAELMASMIERLWLRVGPALHLSKPRRAQMIEALPAHEDLVAAIGARDGRAARAAVSADIAGCFEMLMSRGDGTED